LKKRWLWFAAWMLMINAVAQSPPPVSPLVMNEMLGRPTDTAVTVNALGNRNLEVYFEYGLAPAPYSGRTASATFAAGTPIEVALTGVQPDKRYYYRMRYREVGTTEFVAREEHTFRTQRARGNSFTMVVQADPHMDENSDPNTYRLTLQNELSEGPDFLVDLGDTFMSDKLPQPTYQAVADRAFLLRSYYDTVCHSVPLFLSLGNHEGEWGSRLTNSSENLPVWDTLIRKLYYPNPFPNGFYTGGTKEEKYVGLRESYYAWEWGDALFVVLDPYWYTPQSPELSGDWSVTLGREQYDWLKRTLENSTATFKFVFSHNLIGGWDKGGKMRGGVEAAKYLEWGGYNLDDTWGFDKARPGWPTPIHQLLKANNVTIFFHGHDHFYGKQDLDGIVYQEVPQPSAANTELGNRAASYGYSLGRLLGGVGHLRLTVSPSEVKVDYIRTWIPSKETAGQKNGDLGDSYTIPARRRSTVPLTLAAGGSNHSETLAGNGPVQAGYAAATVQTGSAPYGTAVFSLTQDNVVVSECGVPASPPSSSVRIFVDYGTRVIVPPASTSVDILTGIAVVNHGTRTANITYTLRDGQGRPLAVGHGTLAAGAHRARFLNQLQDLAADFALPADFSTVTRFGTLEVAADQPLSVLALRMTVNQRGNTLFTSVPAADLTKAPSALPLFFPQIADGDGYTTALILLNTTDRTQSGTISFYADGGGPLVVGRSGGQADTVFRYSIEAGGLYLFQSDGSPVEAHVGSVQLIPDAGSTTPAGAGLFSRSSDGILVTESGVPSAVATMRALVFVDLTEGHDSGLAIANAGSSAAQVTVRAYQTDGTGPVSGGSTTVDLQGNGHRAAFARQWITGLPAGFRGLLEISSPTQFAALTLRSLVNPRGDFLLTTFPVADMTRPAPAPMVFPQIADGGGYKTQFILLSSGEAASVTLSLFAEDGSPLAVAK